MWAGVDRRWGGRRAGWLLVRGWTGGWIETRGMVAGGGRVGGKRWLGCLCVSRVGTLCPSTPSPLFLATSTTAPARPALFPFNYPRKTLRTGTTSMDVFAGFILYVYVCLYMCTRVWSARALLYTSRLCVTPYKHHLHLLGATLCAGYVANT